MSIALLDINDCNLQLWHGEAHVQSPGYALLDGQQYRFGGPARAAARLQPRNMNTRFWWQMSTEALQPALGPARHTGDLVHAHLQQLHEEAGRPSELLLAVSGSMQRDQLALLLGIAQQCPFDAVGLVNRSVVMGSRYGGPGRIFHLEVQLHQSVISELAESAGQVELQRTVPMPGCGLLQLQERLVETIATAFIRQTRFDPRRKAATEQDLYDRLPDTLRALGRDSEANIEVNGYRARIHRKDLSGAGQRLFDSSADAMGPLRPDDRVIADPIANLLPGIQDQFNSLEILESDSVRVALQQHETALVKRGQPLNFVTALPCLEDRITPRVAPAPEPEAAPAPPTPAPTHLLQGSTARPLIAAGTSLSEGWELISTQGDWQLQGTGGDVQVNGQAHQAGQALACGDSITIGNGASVLLIEVVP